MVEVKTSDEAARKKINRSLARQKRLLGSSMTAQQSTWSDLATERERR